jgi:hypothetical protein
VRAALLALALAAGTTTAHGHGRSVSYSSWTLAGREAGVEVRATRLELSRLAIAPDAVGDHLAAHVRLLAGGVPCPVVEPPRVQPAPAAWAVWAWRVACPPAGRLAVESDLLLDVAPSHLHFARIATADGTVVERVLADDARRWEIGRGGGTSFGGYVRLGVAHILSGWDHLAFVLALLLLAESLGEVARLVTGFTVAHSITLGLAVLGVVRPDAAAVEALIGFSIALVAAENAWLLAGRDRRIPAAVTAGLLLMAAAAAAGVGAVGAGALVGLALFSACHFGLLARAARPARLRVAVAFAFGLVHGFGFAGVLAEMDLPRARLAQALLGFNLGVELGQLAVVAAVWPLLAWATRARGGRWARPLADAGSAAICGLGVFWLVVRALG